MMMPRIARLLPVVLAGSLALSGCAADRALKQAHAADDMRDYDVAVANYFDSITSTRPYRPALPVDKAFGELQSRAGTQFDPDIVQSFLRLRPKVELAASQVAGALLTRAARRPTTRIYRVALR